MKKLQLEQYEKIAEAILFAGGEPVDQKIVAQAMELDEDAAVAVLESLKTKYEKLIFSKFTFSNYFKYACFVYISFPFIRFTFS